jgi:hypothetical protein
MVHMGMRNLTRRLIAVKYEGIRAREKRKEKKKQKERTKKEKE